MMTKEKDLIEKINNAKSFPEYRDTVEKLRSYKKSMEKSSEACQHCGKEDCYCEMMIW